MVGLSVIVFILKYLPHETSPPLIRQTRRAEQKVLAFHARRVLHCGCSILRNRADYLQGHIRSFAQPRMPCDGLLSGSRTECQIARSLAQRITIRTDYLFSATCRTGLRRPVLRLKTGNFGRTARNLPPSPPCPHTDDFTVRRRAVSEVLKNCWKTSLSVNPGAGRAKTLAAGLQPDQL